MLNRDLIIKISVFLLLVFVQISCKKNQDAEGVKTINKIYFTGITERNSAGDLITIDSTDWNKNDQWTQQEENLFFNIYNTGCSPTSAYLISAYPNPCTGTFMLSFFKHPSTRIELRLVDENFNILYRCDTITRNLIQLNETGIHDTVRLYYKFTDNNCEFKGHGDIVIQ